MKILNKILTVFRVFSIFLGASFANSDEASHPYPFALSPTEIVEKVNAFDVSETQTRFCPTPNELSWIHEAATGTLSADKWEELFLIASGDNDPQHRKACIETIEKWANAMKPKLGSLEDREKAEVILKELHATLMSGGYVEDQSSLAAIFDKKTFNCVSSTVLYHIVCQRLGVQVGFMEFPGSSFYSGHVMAMFDDKSQSIDVETTNVDGFDIRRKLAESGGYSLTMKNIDDGNRIDVRGLLAALYGNRAAEAQDNQRWFNALRFHLLELAALPTSKVKQEHAIEGFKNVAIALNESDKSALAIDVMALAKHWTNNDYGIDKHLEGSYQTLAMKWITEKRDAEVSELYLKASERWPNMEFAAKHVLSYQYVAQETIKDDDFSGAINIVGRGIESAAGEAKEGLTTLRFEYYAAWMNRKLDAKNFPEAIRILKQGYALSADAYEIRKSLAYLTQESLLIVDHEQGAAAMIALAKEIDAAFPQTKEVKDRIEYVIHRAIDADLSAKDFVKANKTLEDRASLLDSEGFERMFSNIVDAQGTILLDKKNWTEAIRVYETGLAKFPTNSLLLNNLAYVKQEAAAN